MRRPFFTYDRSIYTGKIPISYIHNQGVLEYGDYFNMKYATDNDMLTGVNIIASLLLLKSD